MPMTPSSAGTARDLIVALARSRAATDELFRLVQPQFLINCSGANSVQVPGEAIRRFARSLAANFNTSFRRSKCPTPSR